MIPIFIFLPKNKYERQNVTIFYSEILTRKVDLRSFSTSEMLVGKNIQINFSIQNFCNNVWDLFFLYGCRRKQDIWLTVFLHRLERIVVKSYKKVFKEMPTYFLKASKIREIFSHRLRKWIKIN